MNIAFKDALGYTIFCEHLELYDLFNKVFSINKHELLIRLYKNYIKKNDVSATLDILENISELDYFTNKEKKILTLLIKTINECTKTSEYAFQRHNEWGYDPVRLIISDEPFCTISDNIPLEDYDNNDGEPFWMRPKYILEHYSKNNRK